MIHARSDYNRIQDPALRQPQLLSKGSTPIGENEPVFLVRCKDKHFIKMLNIYRDLCAEDDEMSEEQYEIIDCLIGDHMSLAIDWRADNKCQSPTVPRD